MTYNRSREKLTQLRASISYSLSPNTIVLNKNTKKSLRIALTLPELY